jgi:predicted DNA binding protein
MSKRLEGSFKNIRVGETVSSHLIRLSNINDLTGSLRMEDALFYRMGREYLWVDAPSCKACKACKVISRNSAIPLGVLFLKELGVLFTFITPGKITAKKIVDEMSAEGLDVEVLKRSSLRLGNVLTKKQSEVLYAAISMGYFSNTRLNSLADIAKVLGLSKSTVSRHLRAAMKKLVLSQPTESL